MPGPFQSLPQSLPTVPWRDAPHPLSPNELHCGQECSSFLLPRKSKL
jgi:hypothetical protein